MLGYSYIGRIPSTVRALSSAASASECVLLSRTADGAFATVTLNRPKLHNAFSDSVAARLTGLMGELRAEAAGLGAGKLRGVFLRANGKSFSAGGDLEYMRRAAHYSYEENLADAADISALFESINALPVPTFALVQGSAFGGGIGLISCCDMSVCVSSAKFCLSEVKLGLLPATISPFVIARIGTGPARRYFLTAEAFSAQAAQGMGLVHEVVDDAAGLDEWEQTLMAALRVNSPTGVTASKELVSAVAGKPITPELRHDTVVRLCEQRLSEEAKEGLSAFLEKRPPSYALPDVA
jgi:methylglutaconyl-CoA hydratase